MADPTTVMLEIEQDVTTLDNMTRALYEAAREEDDAEKAWDEKLDQVTAQLEEEFAAKGRLTVPEHTALSAARRAFRAEYTRYRTAKRNLSRLERQMTSKRATLNGRQTLKNGLLAEFKAGDFDNRPGGHVFGGQRA